MPSLAEYRRNLAVESGPYIGPESYNVRATSGSDETKLVCSNYPITSGLTQNDLYRERPLYRPSAALEQDRNRFVMTYDPPTGTITPDLIWALSPLFNTASALRYSARLGMLTPHTSGPRWNWG